MNGTELKELLGKDHYQILVHVSKRKRLEGLTMNQILGLFERLREVGLLKSSSRTGIDRTHGAPIRVVLKRETFWDIYGSFLDPEPDQTASLQNVEEAARLLTEVGITPTQA